MDGWSYPRHLEGRLFAVVAHGDAEGVENVRRAVSDWLSSMDLSPAGRKSELDRYIGYWKPYATSHAGLDRDPAVQAEVANAATTLVEAENPARRRMFLALRQEPCAIATGFGVVSSRRRRMSRSAHRFAAKDMPIV